MLSYLIKKIFGVTLVISTGKLDDRMEHNIRHRKKVADAVKKNNNSYIFKKNHEGKKEVFLDDYLKHFMTENFNINNLNL